MTRIQEQHITELRTAIHSWTDSSVQAALFKLNEMRTKLATAVVPFSFSLAPYTYPIAGNQNIHAAEVNELRSNIK